MPFDTKKGGGMGEEDFFRIGVIDACLNVSGNVPAVRDCLKSFINILYIEEMNQTKMTYFIIKGISGVPQLQAPIFLVVLLIYLTTLGSNMTILQLVCQDPQLHTPMYFFLGNLSVLDMSYTTLTLHKVLLTFISQQNSVSYLSYIVQVYMFGSLAVNQLLILTAMSYDRYEAICNPLSYHMTMSRTVCVLLAIFCWVLSFLESVPYLLLLAQYTCYRSNIINHFFCDVMPLLKLTCNDTTLFYIFVYTEGLLVMVLTPFMLTFISYVFIITAILKIRSSSGRRKAFYTCSSHLTVVILLYVSLTCQYIKPSAKDILDDNKMLSLFNTAIVPLLNPLIYTLKNNDVKSALRRKWNTFKTFS
ncbi:olfactory receptor 8D1-like [Bombina bombina]|uniref:olfactory receptor 8D1-like n=1 Tax=Bombina bombina TaxID=8345 RepID=UPI00235A890B|nr:olfactory receptor 8D1-like [Bombina bombina]